MVDFLFIGFQASDPAFPVRPSPALRLPGMTKLTNAPPSPELVAIDDRARIARHVVENAALDKRVHSRMAE